MKNRFLRILRIQKIVLNINKSSISIRDQQIIAFLSSLYYSHLAYINIYHDA